MKFLNPRYDTAFKKLFANEEHKNILISFLNSILMRPEGKKIADVVIKDPNNQPEIESLKFSIVDVYCTDQSNNRYIVEMQLTNRKDFIQRAHYYSSTVYTRQLEEANKYNTLLPVIFVGIINFILFKNPNYITHHVTVDIETMEQTFLYQEYHFVELPKFKKTVSELITDVDKWAYLLKNAETLHAVPQELHASSDIQDAFTILEHGAWSISELERYQAFFDASIAEEIVLETAEEKGKRNKACEIALKMLSAKQLSVQMIAEFTGLTIEEVESLRSSKDQQ